MTLELKPPVEDPSGSGEKLTAKATFFASLDKESFPFELGDVYGLLSSPVGYGVGKSFDLLRDVLVKAGLPSQAIQVSVDYHGTDIIVAKGSNSVHLILATLPKVYVDLVSGAGLAGPFKGTAGYDGGQSTDLLKMAGAVFGINVPGKTGGRDNQINVMTTPGIEADEFLIMKGEGGAQFMDGRLSLYP